MNIVSIIQSLIFASPAPITSSDILKVIKEVCKKNEDNNDLDDNFKNISLNDVNKYILELKSEISSNQNIFFELKEGSKGWEFITKVEYSKWIKELIPKHKPEKLNSSSLETLTLIAYRQPIIKSDIEAIRGVSSTVSLNKLIDSGLVKIAGKSNLPGKPLLYETTEKFIEYFDLKNLEELPNFEELKKIELVTDNN